jgi:hypothetical protein
LIVTDDDNDDVCTVIKEEVLGQTYGTTNISLGVGSLSTYAVKERITVK